MCISRLDIYRAKTMLWPIIYPASLMTCSWLTCLIRFVAAQGIKELDQELSITIGQAWAPSSLKTRNSKWSEYTRFCVDMGFSAMPADPRCTCLEAADFLQLITICLQSMYFINSTATILTFISIT